MGIVSAVVAIAGLGLGVAGYEQQLSAAHRQQDAQQQLAAQQQQLATAQQQEIQQQHAAQEKALKAQEQQNALQKQASELDARKRTLEVIRNQQRARSLAVAAAAGQGALFGSGIAGGVGQIQGQTGNQALSISQGLGFGEQIYGLNTTISQANQAYSQAGYDYSQAAAQYNYNAAGLGGQMASAQGQYATGVGLVNFGGALMSVGPTLNKLSSINFSGPSYNTGYGTGSSYGAVY